MFALNFIVIVVIIVSWMKSMEEEKYPVREDSQTRDNFIQQKHFISYHRADGHTTSDQPKRPILPQHLRGDQSTKVSIKIINNVDDLSEFYFINHNMLNYKYHPRIIYAETFRKGNYILQNDWPFLDLTKEDAFTIKYLVQDGKDQYKLKEMKSQKPLCFQLNFKKWKIGQCLSFSLSRHQQSDEITIFHVTDGKALIETQRISKEYSQQLLVGVKTRKNYEILKYKREEQQQKTAGEIFAGKNMPNYAPNLAHHSIKEIQQLDNPNQRKKYLAQHSYLDQLTDPKKRISWNPLKEFSRIVAKKPLNLKEYIKQSHYLSDCYIIAAMDQLIIKAPYILDEVWTFIYFSQDKEQQQACCLLNIDGNLVSVRTNLKVPYYQAKPQRWTWPRKKLSSTLIEAQKAKVYASESDQKKSSSDQRVTELVNMAVLIEKALAIVFGGYQKLQYGFSEEIYMILTNFSTNYYRLEDWHKYIKQMVMWKNQLIQQNKIYSSYSSQHIKFDRNNDNTTTHPDRKEISHCITINFSDHGFSFRDFYCKYTRQEQIQQTIKKFKDMDKNNNKLYNELNNIVVKLADNRGPKTPEEYRNYFLQQYKEYEITDGNKLKCGGNKIFQFYENQFFITLGSLIGISGGVQICEIKSSKVQNSNDQYEAYQYTSEQAVFKQDKAEQYVIQSSDNAHCEITVHHTNYRFSGISTQKCDECKKKVHPDHDKDCFSDKCLGCKFCKQCNEIARKFCYPKMIFQIEKTLKNNLTVFEIFSRNDDFGLANYQSFKYRIQGREGNKRDYLRVGIHPANIKKDKEDPIFKVISILSSSKKTVTKLYANPKHSNLSKSRMCFMSSDELSKYTGQLNYDNTNITIFQQVKNNVGQLRLKCECKWEQPQENPLSYFGNLIEAFVHNNDISKIESMKNIQKNYLNYFNNYLIPILHADMQSKQYFKENKEHRVVLNFLGLFNINEKGNYLIKLRLNTNYDGPQGQIAKKFKKMNISVKLLSVELKEQEIEITDVFDEKANETTSMTTHPPQEEPEQQKQ